MFSREKLPGYHLCGNREQAAGTMKIRLAKKKNMSDASDRIPGIFEYSRVPVYSQHSHHHHLKGAVEEGDSLWKHPKREDARTHGHA